VRRCQELPGQTLFQYLDGDGNAQTIGSSDVNAYLQAITGESFTAKDFRTWSGTLATAKALAALEPPASESAAKRAIVAAVGRGRGAARQHRGGLPALLRAPARARRVSRRHPRELRAPSKRPGRGFASTRRGLRLDETMLLALLRRRA
jgi:DNA topoisomerase-1